MPRFSRRSRRHLATCHADLRRVLERVIRHYDVIVLEGHRPRHRQDRLHAEGRSQVRWPHSRHNKRPSRAVDLAPWPVDWTDRERFTLMAGYVLGIAAQMGVGLRWGGDWDRDTQVRDNRFDDLVHFELID